MNPALTSASASALTSAFLASASALTSTYASHFLEFLKDLFFKLLSLDIDYKIVFTEDCEEIKEIL